MASVSWPRAAFSLARDNNIITDTSKVRVGNHDTVTVSDHGWSRRSWVYGNIMKRWQEAAELASIQRGPKPRCTHPRVLGSQALCIRQHRRSLSGTCQTDSLSWGNSPKTSSLSDTISPAAQSAWREQLFRHKLRRLSGVPMAVLLRQSSCYRVVAAESNLSAELTASAVIAGTCKEVFGLAASTSSQQIEIAATAGVVDDITKKFKGGVTRGVAVDVTNCTSAIDAKCRVGDYPPRSNGSGGTGVLTACKRFTGGSRRGTNRDSLDSSAAGLELAAGGRRENVRCPLRDVHGPPEAIKAGEQTSTPSVVSEDDSEEDVIVEDDTSITWRKIPHVPVQVPTRGFHLVDLHAVVRNCAEWSHCLPKVEPCFRVSDNRDDVLLGLVHALGGRLCCSSTPDIIAGTKAARTVSLQVPPSPLRVLDRHVCRSPTMLRAAATSDVSLYEVDCIDELRRIATARRSSSIAASQPPSDHGDISFEARNAVVNERKQDTPQATFAGVAEALIRLVPPFRPRRLVNGVQDTDVVAQSTKLSTVLKPAFGASADDVVEIVKIAAAMEIDRRRSSGNTKNGRGTAGGSATPNAAAAAAKPLERFMPSIVGFSIDVGAACWDDAVAAAAEVAAGAPLRHPAASRVAPGEAIASATLTEDIGAAVLFAVEVARRASEAADAVETAASGEHETGGKPGHTRRGGETRSTHGASCPKLFDFRRLHVTGLGGGGARGEPLVALKTVQSRYLTTITAGGGGGGFDGVDARTKIRPVATKPIVVSADATEHLVAGGVWSTVASIIGRKDAAPSDTAHPPAAPKNQFAEHDDYNGSGARSCPERTEAPVARGDGVDQHAKGAMYYIDDGCYGSLSGALLRGMPMQPSPLVQRGHPFPSRDSTKKNSRSVDLEHPQDAAITTPPPRPTTGLVSISEKYPPVADAADSTLVPCTVWGPTCDGLDCVSRMTPLPADLEPGRDWLFFPDRGMRARADTSAFNGLQPLDAYYCIRQPDAAPPVSSPKVKR